MDGEEDAEGDGEHVSTAVVRSSSSPPPHSRSVTRTTTTTTSYDCRQRIGAVLCSHIGVAIVLSAYFAMGAFLFRALESPAEIEARSRLSKLREESLEGIWRLGVVTWQDGGPGVPGGPGGPEGGGPVIDQGKANFTDGLKELLLRYQQQIGSQGGRGGGADYGSLEPEADAIRWSFVGALLYSVTVVTTVGYGHVTPRTGWGRLLTILYGLIGIPLMVLYLWKMGALLAEGFRLFYQKVCCDLCCCKRCERARRRRRSGVLYQPRSDVLPTTGTYSSSSYRVGYSRRGRPTNSGGLVVESPVDSNTDPTQGLLLTPTDNLEFMRGDSEAGTCVNMAFHSSLPRSVSRANRDWRTQSSHVYETISMIDDVNSGHVVMKTRPRSFAPARNDSRVRYSKGGTWSPEQRREEEVLQGSAGKGQTSGAGAGSGERERTLDHRRLGVESLRDRTLDNRKTSDEKSATLPRSSSHQRRSSQSQVRMERKPSRLSSSEAPTSPTNTNSLGGGSGGRGRQSSTVAPPTGTDRPAEARPSSSTTAAKQKPRPLVTRRPVTTTTAASSPRMLRAKTVPTLLLDGRRQKRSSNPHQPPNNQHQTTAARNSSAGQPDRHQKKGGRRRGTGRTGSPQGDVDDWPVKSSLGQSDESFVTAPDDSSSEVDASTETGSVEDEAGGGTGAGGAGGRRKFSKEEPRKKKKRLGSEKRRKRTTEKGDGGGEADGGGLAARSRSRHPLTVNSIGDDGVGRDPPKTDDDQVESRLDPIYSTSDDEYGYSRRRHKAPVPIGACIMVMVTYIFAGSLGFCLWEGWDYATGPYFCFVTLSTIGFGDFVPGAETRRTASTERLLVCMVWLLLGLTLLAMCAMLIAEHFGRKTIILRTSSRR